MARIDDYKDVIKLAYQTEAFWQRSKLEMVKGHHWYTMNVPVSTPKGVEFSAPPTAPSLVNDAADHLAGAMPKFEVKAIHDTQKADLDRTRLQIALNGMYERLARQYGKSLHRSLAIMGGWSGMMAARIGVRENWDYDKPSWQDFYWQPMDSRYVFPDPGSLGGEFVIYRMRRTVGSVRQAWPDWEGMWYEAGTANSLSSSESLSRHRLPERLPDTSMVDWIEYWDDEVKCFIANGHPVFEPTFGKDIIPHLLGVNPIIIRAAGYGDDTGEAWERFRSMLFWVFHLLEWEAKLQTQIKWIVEDTAWPTFLAPESMKDLDLTPGTVNYVPDMTAIKEFRSIREDAVEPKAVIDLLAYVQGQIEKATYPVVIKGQAPNGIKAGYPIAILSTQAKLKFAAPSDALGSMLEELSYKTLAIVKNRIAMPVETIDGRFIEPTDFDKYWGRIKVELEPQLPTDVAADLPRLQFSVGSLELPREVALREMGYDNPIELQEMRIVEDLALDPKVKEVMGLELMKDLNPEYAKALEQMLNPAIEAQKTQAAFQVIQAQLQDMQAQMAIMQLMPQFQQMKQMQAQGGGMPPPQQPGMPPPGGPGQGAGGGRPPVQGGASAPPMVSGGPGGTDVGQALGSPNQMGQSMPQVNPLTTMTQEARALRANRTVSEMTNQNEVYGAPSGGGI